MIGAAWDTSDPLKPWALFDSDADIKIPIGLAAWLAELGTTYNSHVVIAADPLECMNAGTMAGDGAGTVLVRMRRKPAAAFVANRKYPFTVRLVGSDGTTQDDRTFWLKLVSR